MKLEELLRGVEILEANAPMDTEIGEVRYSSREVERGDLFVAVPGFATDGHRYIPDAIGKGAAVVLCEREMPDNAPWVRVASCREALAAIGANRYGHPARSMKMIGVTGTNGKTSVTYLVKAILENALHAKVGLIGTICNMIGGERLETERTTPESYELQGLLAKMRDAGCTHVVMEVSSHALFLHRVGGIEYDVGAFTNLTEDHLDFHGTMENYRRAKAILFRSCRRGVFNLDDPTAPKMIADASCAVYTVGETPEAELRAEDVHLFSDGIEARICEGAEAAPLHLGIPGRFTVSNALVALGIARQLGLPLQTAVAALEPAKGVKGRVEVVPTPGKEFTVLIDYAHTPDGLEQLLRSVRDFCSGRLIAVFGCGGDRERTKRRLMGSIAVNNADYVIVTSDNPRTEEPMAIIRDILEGVEGTATPYAVEPDRRKAIRMALRFAQKNDIVVLAGKGHETYQILGTRKTHLDEREEVAQALAETE